MGVVRVSVIVVPAAFAPHGCVVCAPLRAAASRVLHAGELNALTPCREEGRVSRAVGALEVGTVARCRIVARFHDGSVGQVHARRWRRWRSPRSG